MIRRIVSINEEKCNGCGLCIPACHEGAIQIIDGKAKLLEDKLCDGIGDCLGECPLGAIEIIEREADEFDEEAVKEHLAKLENKAKPQDRHKIPCGCPGTMSRMFEDKVEEDTEEGETAEVKSTLRQWPVQLSLVPVNAPYFENAELLIAADCAPFAYGNFHQLQKGKAIAIGCPKLDDGNYYADKLTQILKSNNIRKITVARMEVPCCGGLNSIVNHAVAQSGKEIPVETKTISIQGKIIS
ncbi:ATP-binding protein [Desulfitibacter alkalitolerans]|uniref:ATP-binding protein n=1 Tax=Desulfitibacter alkalitolerans TaxID=264641 RepID=UPI000487E898|nr:4Fe-4S binding protein [Desulfitibacter alkalitolerans]